MVKKISVSVILFFVVSMVTAQVGIQTKDPNATFEIKMNTTNGSKPEGLLIPRLSAIKVRQMESEVGADQNSMLVFITETSTSASSGKYEYIDAPGYYYYEHNTDNTKSRWKKLLDTNNESTGLEKITENNNKWGWRFIGADANNYGNIGENAVDLSYSAGPSDEYGATGAQSFAVGQNAQSKGTNAIAMGYGTVASGTESVAMGSNAKVLGGYYSVAIGRDVETTEGNSLAMGVGAKAMKGHSISIGYGTETEGQYSYAFGRYTKAYSANSMALGFYNTEENNPIIDDRASNTDNRLFVIGNGWTSTKSDAFTILRNGKVGINIDNFETNKSDAKLQVNGKTLIGNFGDNATTNNTISAVKNATRAQLDVRGDIAVGTMTLSTSMNDKVVVWDDSTGVLKSIKRSVLEKNIYTNNGTITGTRSVTLADDNSNITFSKSGTNTNPLLVVNGTIKMTAADMNSDARLKQNVADLSSENIEKLRSVSYLWNNEGKKRGGNDKLQYGFIAQEVEKVYPNLVSTDKDGYKSVNYMQVIPILTKAIQEERHVNKEQQEQLDKQAKEIEELKKLVKQLMDKE